MPKERALENLLPRANAWDWRIDYDQLSDPVWVFFCQGERDHVADIMGNHVGPLDHESIEDIGNVGRLIHLGESAGRLP